MRYRATRNGAQMLLNARRIILVEDDPLLRRSLERLLRASDYDVLSLACAEALVDHFDKQPPAPHGVCILMDVNLGDIDGVQAQHRLRLRQVKAPIIFMSGQPDADTVNQAWRGGACEFLFKPFTPEQLLDSLDLAFKGLQPARTVPVDEDAAARRLPSPEALWERLTQRQRQVLPLLARGHTHAEIASHIGIAARTVKMHRAAIMRRLELGHLADLVRFHDACSPLLEPQDHAQRLATEPESP